MITRIKGFLVLAFILAGTVRAGELPFSADELARLEAGEVIIRHVEQEDGGTVSSRLTSVVLVRQPEEVVWEVLNRPERESEWLPGVEKSEVVSDQCPTASTRAVAIDYLLSPLGIDVYYTLVREYDYENRTISARLDPARPHRFFKDIKAGWDFFPYKGGTIYQGWSVSKLVVELPDFIAEPLGEKALIEGGKAIAARCDQVAAEMKKTAPTPPCPAP